MICLEDFYSEMAEIKPGVNAVLLYDGGDLLLKFKPRYYGP